jgi:formate dehydrogenase iron-sulfur subunit
VRGGDAHALRLEHAHWPLILMLILTQMSVGMFAVLVGLAVDGGARAILAISAFGALQLGLGVSVLHLGRPLGAWRFFLGLRTSWMSREILAFGLLAAAAGACALAGVAAWLRPRWQMPMFSEVGNATPLLAWVTTMLGLGAVYCSAMIYIDTRRPFWRAAVTLPKFCGTTLLLGTTMAAFVLGWVAAGLDPATAAAARGCAIAATFIRTALFAWEATGFLSALRDPAHENHRPALTIWTLRRSAAVARPLLFVASTAFGLYAITHGGLAAAVAATVAGVTTTASQIIERYFYFTAVVAPRMPGGVTA